VCCNTAMDIDRTESNTYAILGISPYASVDEIKRAYHRLAPAHHPDLHPDDPSAAGRFIALTEAYTLALRNASGVAAAPADSAFDCPDCLVEARVSALEAAAGTLRQFTFHNAAGQPYTIAVQIPPGIQHGKCLRLEGMGGPSRSGDRRGALVVVVKILQPSSAEP
jgi:DnaJ-class molecular chaperone